MSEWPVVVLDNLITQRRKSIFIDDFAEYKRCRVQLHAQGIVLRDAVSGAEIKTKKQQVCKAGDFLVAEIDAKVGGFGIVPDDLEGAIVSSHYFLFEIDEEKLNRHFLDYFIRTPNFRDQVTAQGSTNYAAIRPNDVLGYQVPLPPLPEQRRIVARIEELAAKINEARGLSQQVIEESEALTSAYLHRLFGDYYKSLTGQLKLPNWTKLNDVVTDVADGPHITPTYVAEGIPFITVLNITSGRIHFSNHKYVTPDDHAQFQKRAKAEAGDVLISKDGTIGTPCFVDTDRPFSFFVSVALIKPQRGKLDGKFLAWVIRTPYLQERIKSRSRGDMIRHLVLREIRDLMIPLPSLQEQRRIVAELEPLQAKADRLRKLQAETAAELDALLPSILDSAFKGEL